MNQQPTPQEDTVSAAYERGRAQTLTVNGYEALASIGERMGTVVEWIEHVTEQPDVNLWIAEAMADFAADPSMSESEENDRIENLREEAREIEKNTLSLTEAYEQSRHHLLDIVQDLGRFSGDRVATTRDQQEDRARFVRWVNIHLDHAGLGTISK